MNDKIFSKVIESCIQKLKENAEPFTYNEATDEQIDICKIVTEQNFLPIFYDWTAFCSVRPNDEMVWYDYENPTKLKVEENKRMRNIAIVKGIERFPELSAFFLQRTSNDVDCPQCESTKKTREQLPEHFRNAINCYCGGLGWIPKNRM